MTAGVEEEAKEIQMDALQAYVEAVCEKKATLELEVAGRRGVSVISRRSRRITPWRKLGDFTMWSFRLVLAGDVRGERRNLRNGAGLFRMMLVLKRILALGKKYRFFLVMPLP